MKETLTAIRIIIIMTLLTGIIYPLLITGTGQLLFPYRSNGSLVRTDAGVLGSELIARNFSDSAYFQSRPSAGNYETVPSSASNFGPANKNLAKQVSERYREFISGNDLKPGASVPPEMLFASGSGIDPHISPEAAFLQLNRVARVRGFSSAQKQKLEELVSRLIEKRQFSMLGEERINVLLLNFELDKIR